MENFFNYNSPTDNFYLASLDVFYVFEWVTQRKYQLLHGKTNSRIRSEYVGFKCFSFTMPQAKYALWIINDRVELGMSTCAHINHIFMHQIIKHFFYFFVVYFLRHFANQIMFNLFSNVRAVYICECVCLIRMAPWWTWDTLRDRIAFSQMIMMNSKLDFDQPTVQHLWCVLFARYKSASRWWISVCVCVLYAKMVFSVAKARFFSIHVNLLVARPLFSKWNHVLIFMYVIEMRVNTPTIAIPPPVHHFLLWWK